MSQAQEIDQEAIAQRVADILEKRFGDRLERLMTTAEAANVARCEEKTIRGYIAAGELPALRTGRRWLVKRQDLMAMLERFRDEHLASEGGLAGKEEAELERLRGRRHLRAVGTR